MSYKQHKVVTVTPAGRKRYLEILHKYLLANRHIIDEHHFWVNTTESYDIAYMQELADKYPGFFKLDYPTIPVNGNFSIHHFFRPCVEPNTVYIRFDDDICWMAPDAVQQLIDFRLKHPNYFVVFGNIVNNAICTHLHQRMGCIDSDIGICEYNAVCPIGWKSGAIAAAVHEAFLGKLKNGTADDYKFDKWVLWDTARFSINCFSWLGQSFAEFNGEVQPDEELFISVHRPAKSGKNNVICGKALFSHYAFHPQRPYLEKNTDILESYKQLADSVMS